MVRSMVFNTIFIFETLNIGSSAHGLQVGLTLIRKVKALVVKVDGNPRKLL